jgi:hypothetical protein
MKSQLPEILQAGAGKGHPVVFDFDNTVICGDIGEATLATLINEGLIQKSTISKSLCPDFTLPDGKKISMDLLEDPTMYYEQLLKSGGPTDPTPLATGYTWCVEVMEGLTVWDVVAATQKAFAQTEPGIEKFITVSPGGSTYPIPFFYPEILDLLHELIQKKYEIWVVSASNVWTIRWMVLNALNPILKAMGAPNGILPGHVIGISTLMQDGRGRLLKDPVLAKANPDYLNLQPDFLKTLTLTSRLHFPVSTYSGKVQCILDYIGKKPYLAAGDSPGDHPMLLFSDYKLWLARLEKPDYQQQTAKLMTDSTKSQWVIWPTRCKKTPGIIHDLEKIEAANSSSVAAALKILKQF